MADNLKTSIIRNLSRAGLASSLLAALFLLCFAGCSSPELEPDPPQPAKPTDPKDVLRTVLVYAVNRSSLASDFINDSDEMLKAMTMVDPRKFRLLLYRTDSDTDCGLYEARVSLSGSFEFVEVKDYERDVTSTHPKRIKEVIDDALSMYPDAAYDLVFWGHGMSWRPDFSDHVVDPGPMNYGYGGEYNPSGTSLEWTAIDELADAVPDHRFETIWFDCCYMTGIEVVYEMRNKCSTFVGYPTEVWQDGMQYDETLPYLMRETPDITGAAMKFYQHYAEAADPVTVAVIDMSKIESLAEAASNALASGISRPESADLLNYSRSRSWSFYDFRQFFAETARLNGAEETAKALEKSVNEAVVFSAAYGTDFNKRPWDVNKISGLSTHYYQGLDTPAEEFYRTLDWYRRVYGDF